MAEKMADRKTSVLDVKCDQCGLDGARHMIAHTLLPVRNATRGGPAVLCDPCYEMYTDAIADKMVGFDE